MAKKTVTQSKATPVLKKSAKDTKAPAKAKGRVLPTKAIGRTGQAKVTTDGNVTVVEIEPATFGTIGGVKAPAAEPKKSAKVTTTTKKTKVTPITDVAPDLCMPENGSAAEPSDKKLSCVAAALKVLRESPEPLSAPQMIEAMGAKGYWSSPAGKTPHATLYSALLREITTMGTESRFVKAERGRFAAKK